MNRLFLQELNSQLIRISCVLRSRPTYSRRRNGARWRVSATSGARPWSWCRRRRSMSVAWRPVKTISIKTTPSTSRMIWKVILTPLNEMPPQRPMAGGAPPQWGGQHYVVVALQTRLIIIHPINCFMIIIIIIISSLLCCYYLITYLILLYVSTTISHSVLWALNDTNYPQEQQRTIKPQKFLILL